VTAGRISVIGALHAGTLQDLDERKGIDGLVRDRSSDHAGHGAGKFVEVPSVVAGQFVDLALMALAQQYGDSSGRKVRTARAGGATLTGGSDRGSCLLEGLDLLHVETPPGSTSTRRRGRVPFACLVRR
jgi:hypothetical protein